MDDRATARSGVRTLRVRVGGVDYLILTFSRPRFELPGTLTRAEAAVVEAALTGLTNIQIARRRRCSPRTVANQLASAYRRLGISGRAELAACCARLATARRDSTSRPREHAR